MSSIGVTKFSSHFGGGFYFILIVNELNLFKIIASNEEVERI